MGEKDKAIIWRKFDIDTIESLDLLIKVDGNIFMKARMSQDI